MGFSQWDSVPWDGAAVRGFQHHDRGRDVEERGNALRPDLYMIRSMYSPHMTCCLDVRKTDFPWDDLRAILDEWRAIVPYYQGDLYPFTEFSTADDCWAAWQFDRPDLSGASCRPSGARRTRRRRARSACTAWKRRCATPCTTSTQSRKSAARRGADGAGDHCHPARARFRRYNVQKSLTCRKLQKGAPQGALFHL